MKLILGDSKIKLKDLPENSVDSVVTDPPYGLQFMGKKWDYDVPSVELWKEVHRVLKPGGFLLSFGGSRTYHRMAVNIEDAGFEIRDQIMWIYGSGFPKSHNIGKAVDKLEGNVREDVGMGKYFNKQPNGLQGASITNFKDSIGKKYGSNGIESKGTSVWKGWGTALKPAHEPIVMARKPLSEKSVALNVLKWGTGGINIDESRVQFQSEKDLKSATFGTQTDIRGNNYNTNKPSDGHVFKTNVEANPVGRWPANIIHDGSDEVTDNFPNTTSGKVKTDKSSYKSETNVNFLSPSTSGVSTQSNQHGDSGSAARFFYCPKASKTDRNEGLDDFEGKAVGTLNANSSDLENYSGSSLGAASLKGEHKNPQPKKNFHPTVKPTELMKYLVRMVTQNGGTVLDPFMGSGSTGKACKQLGYDFIGIELDEDYFNIAKGRIDSAVLDGEIYIGPKQKENINKFFDL